MSDQNTTPKPAVELTDLATDPQELTEKDEKNIAGGKQLGASQTNAVTRATLKVSPASGETGHRAVVADGTSNTRPTR